MIFLSNDITKYPQAILNASQRLNNLEMLTGADMLVSPLNHPLNNLSEIMPLPQKLGLQKHVQAGLLVQVKLGRDFTASIPNLYHVLIRMLEWTTRPWLFIRADMHEDRNGMCNLDGQDTHFEMNAVRGFLNYWQLRGGMYHIEERDSGFVSWVNITLSELRDLQENQIKFVSRPIAQAIIGSNSALNTLTSFDNIGQEKAQCILDYCGTLADSLSWLSDLESSGISGVGEKTLKLAHHKLGLKDDEMLIKTTKGDE